MGLFDKIKSQATSAIGQTANNIGNGSNKTAQVTFASMPETLAEFQALSQAAMQTPVDTVAMTVAALCVYPLNKNECTAMLNFLRGPNVMSARDISFLTERMTQNNKAGFLGASYLNGATPQNDYTPAEPYVITISENPYSYEMQGCAKLFVKSGGGDSPRSVTMRQAKDNKWYLWEYSSLLLDIRAPESTNPWK